MAQLPDRPFRLRLGLASAAIALACSASAARAAPRPRALAPAPPPLHVPVSVDELLLRRDRPDAYAAGRAECFAYVAQRAEDPVIAWYVFPRRGDAGRPRVLAGLGWEERSAVEAACGPDAAQLNRIVHATCAAPSTLFDVLRAPELLAWSPPDLPAAHQWVALRDRPDLGPARELGCARVVTARDGRARVWVPLRERLAGPGEAEGGGASVLRGLAFLQVRLEDGRVAVYRDGATEDLHLDSLVEALEPFPGPADRPRFLVLGARTFEGMAPAAVPRRYAFVLEVDAAGPRLLRGRFALREGLRDVLLLQGRDPTGGDFRFHALRLRRLAWSPGDGVLSLAPPGRRLAGVPGDGLAAAPVARLEGGVFRVERGRWDGTAERPGDASVWLSDRWGGVDEIGRRGLDEILGMRGGEPARRRGTRASLAVPLDAGAVAAR